MLEKWRPSNEPTRYDEARVARLKPIKIELEKLGIPLIRLRKLNGILNALEMQIEDGGDNPLCRPAGKGTFAGKRLPRFECQFPGFTPLLELNQALDLGKVPLLALRNHAPPAHLARLCAQFLPI